MSMQYLEYVYNTKLFIIYLKFRFNWASCILSRNPNCILTDQKIPRTAIPVLQIIASDDACCNRLDSLRVWPRQGVLAAMKQMIQPAKSATSYVWTAIDKNTWMTLGSIWLWRALGCHPRARATRSPRCEEDPACSTRALDPLPTRPKAAPLRDLRRDHSGISKVC